jgi:hypothetical protein
MLWQHQISEVSYINNQMLWTGWVLEAIQTLFFLVFFRELFFLVKTTVQKWCLFLWGLGNANQPKVL